MIIGDLPATPILVHKYNGVEAPDGAGNTITVAHHGGFTQREEIAIRFMSAILSRNNSTIAVDELFSGYAKRAIMAADIIIAQLNKTEP